ncbi:hypothetical protein MQE36_15370 [Zhouia spongiae]|uniref:Uncharacterized protein n=1 Tax=Zhouia spongiae TaxID=2202721 RepID=A0ABY3YLG6_9FLAO|nr:hypothetical protein [Zhouia spongiae]UNY98447.1 hypothetical protein MQE36_15370 [Zhouia spongiae]
MFKTLVQHVFEKARLQTGKESKNGQAEYLAHIFTEDYKYSITTRALTAIYNKYVLENPSRSATIKPELADVMSIYLGFKNHSDFATKQNETDTGSGSGKENHLSLSQKGGRERITIVVLGVIILGMLFYNFFGHNDRPEEGCMIWDGDHYTLVSCDLKDRRDTESEVVLFDKKMYDHMKKIGYGSVKVGSSYYCKVNKDSLEFFSWYGLHPVSKANLKPVTQYIYDKYVQPAMEEYRMISKD